jgi:hypothetical protein
MSTERPLMPKATAVWLVENTALSFDQIAEFCGLHILEVQGIADGDVAAGIRGKDPITGGELSRDEIKRAEADPLYQLKLLKSKIKLPEIKTKKAARYTPTSRRQDRPNAILWLVKNHPELKDSQIIKLVGTTKPTIAQIRERTHWNSPNLLPQDPVTLGLCSQMDLDAAVQKAAIRVRKELEASGEPIPEEGSLQPTAVTTGYDPAGRYGDLPVDPGAAPQPDVDFGLGEQPRLADEDPTEDARVFAKLQGMSGSPGAAGADEPQPSLDDVFGTSEPHEHEEGAAVTEPLEPATDEQPEIEPAAEDDATPADNTEAADTDDETGTGTNTPS